MDVIIFEKLTFIAFSCFIHAKVIRGKLSTSAFFFHMGGKIRKKANLENKHGTISMKKL